MRLTTHSDLAFKTLVFLGVAGDSGATIAEIAMAFGVSENHLRKVALDLVKLKIVKATRGRHGGLRLEVSPEQLSIGELMRKFEPDFAESECLGAAQKGCVIFGACGLQRVFNESLDALFAVLDRYTLADVLTSSQGLAVKLGVDVSPPPA